jgi:uncharacterized protein with FMN-binding domain
MRRILTVLGATVVGLLGVLALYPRSKAQLGTPASNKTHSSSKVSKSKSSAPVATPLPVGPTSVTGPLTNYGYGDISVTVDVKAHKIVHVSVAKFQALDQYSVQIEQAAVPLLQTEVLKAQGLPISIVTGATYTSQGFAYSLQGALNKLKGK